MKKQILSEEFRRMQKLAGIIKEYVEDIYPDDQKRDMLDMLLNKYVKQALGMGEDERIGTHPNSDCIDSKWEAINNKFMATDWNQFSESDLRQAVQDANFKECLVVNEDKIEKSVNEALRKFRVIENQVNEEEEEEKVQDSIEKAINSPQSQATLQKMADQLSDEDKQRIMKFMSSINESAAGAEEPDLEDVTKKLMSLAENKGPQDPQSRSDARHLLGQVVYGAPVVAMGAGLIKGILAGGAAVGLAAATPLFSAAAAGAVLIGLYKIISSFSSKEKPTSNKVSGINISNWDGKKK